MDPSELFELMVAEYGLGYKTPIWEVLLPIRVNPFNITCELVHFATQYPDDGSAQDFERDVWNYGINKKLEQLTEEGFETKLEETDGRKSLFVKRAEDTHFVRSMVPGIQYRLVGFDPNHLVLYVESTLYSEVEALKFKEYRDLFREKGLPVPYGPIAPVLMLTTPDGKLLLSKRGTATNKYPGVLWGFGGDVDNPNISIGDHLVKVERRQELQCVKGEVPIYETIGITFDNVLHKHDLVVHAFYPETSEFIRKGDKLLPDVESIIEIPFRRDELTEYMISNFVNSLDHESIDWIDKPSGACYPDMLLFGWRFFGKSWADNVFAELQKQIEQSIVEEVSVQRTYNP